MHLAMRPIPCTIGQVHLLQLLVLNKLRFFEMLLVTIKVTKYISELLEIISYIPERFWILIVDFKQIPKIGLSVSTLL